MTDFVVQGHIYNVSKKKNNIYIYIYIYKKMLFFGTYVSSNNSKFMVSTKIYIKSIFEHKRLYAIC